MSKPVKLIVHKQAILAHNFGLGIAHSGHSRNYSDIHSARTHRSSLPEVVVGGLHDMLAEEVVLRDSHLFAELDQHYGTLSVWEAEGRRSLTLVDLRGRKTLAEVQNWG